MWCKQHVVLLVVSCWSPGVCAMLAGRVRRSLAVAVLSSQAHCCARKHVVALRAIVVFTVVLGNWQAIVVLAGSGVILCMSVMLLLLLASSLWSSQERCGVRRQFWC